MYKGRKYRTGFYQTVRDPGLSLYQSPAMCANAGSMNHFRFQIYHLPVSFVWSYEALYSFPIGLSDEITTVPLLRASLPIVCAVSKK